MDERIPSTGYLFVGDPILNRRSLTFLMGDLIVIAMLGGKDRGTQAVWRTKLAEIDRNVSRLRFPTDQLSRPPRSLWANKQIHIDGGLRIVSALHRA